MANVAWKQEGRPASGRKRINRKRSARRAGGLPVIGTRGRNLLGALAAVGVFAWGLLRVMLFGSDGVVRLRGPGLIPEERHEFESAEAKLAVRRTGWL